MTGQPLSPPPGRIGYFPALDGLRGIAILIVVAFHARFPYLMGGFIGVDIFFLLSGFLITLTLLKEHERQGRINFTNFYMRRILRLFPALVLLLLVYTGYIIWGYEGDELSTHLAAIPPVLFYYVNWTRAFDILRPTYLGHAWSLSIEEQFYIVWPLVFALLMARVVKLRLVILITIGLSLASLLLRVVLLNMGTNTYRLYNGSDTRADIILLGCALAIALANPTSLEVIRRSPLFSRLLHLFTLPAVLILVFLGIYSEIDDPWMYRVGFMTVGVCSALVVLHTQVFEQSLLARLLILAPLVWIGKVSYGLYLWHYPIFQIMRSHGVSNLLILTVGTLISLVFTVISFYYVERTFLRLKSRFG
jgi:peptidoglycan/LPS O-acetylase OafA/YrhL